MHAVMRRVLLSLAALAAACLPAPEARAQAGMAPLAEWLPREIRLGGGRITLDHAGLGVPYELRLDGSRVLSRGARGTELGLVGTIAGQRFTLSALLPAPTGQAQPFDAALELAGIEAKVSGSRAAGGRLEMTLQAAGDGAAVRGLAPAFPFDGPVALDGRLRVDGAAITAEDLRLVMAGGETTGGLALSTGQVPRLKGSLVTTRIALPATPDAGDPASPGSREGSLFSDTPLPFPRLDALNLELDVEVGPILRGDMPVLDAAKATLLVAGRRARIGALDLSFAGARYLGGLVIDRTGAQPTLSLNLKSENVDLGAFAASWGAAHLFEAIGRLQLQVELTGQTTRQLAGSLSGSMAAYFVNGRISAEAAGAPVIGMQRFFGMVTPRRSDWVAMPCLVARLDADQGVVRPRLLLIDTAVATGIGEGKVDLREERWALTLTPHPKGIDLSLGVPIRVTGPLGAPRVRPDEAGLAATVGRLVGTALIFPPALLADALLGVGESDPCGQILKHGVKTVTPRQSPGQGLADGINRGLRDLLGR